jgi:hypothetical protein
LLHAKIPLNNNVIAHNINSQLSSAQLEEANLKLIANGGMPPTYLRLRGAGSIHHHHFSSGADNSTSAAANSSTIRS